MKVLAIIGTAGRGSDILHLNKEKYETMIDCAKAVAKHLKVDKLVSGGAAWADHVALELDYPLELWLPQRKADIEVAQKYHTTFSRVIGRDTFREVLDRPYNSFGGFKDRNSRVANAATYFLAMTFGNGPEVKDGGTKDTVVKMKGKLGYHLDLWKDELFEIV